MSPGKYSRLVPSIFKEARDEASFMERYLKIFEDILEDEGKKENKQNNEIIPHLFNPDYIREDFLSFLWGSMGLIFRENWDIKTKREIISRIIPLYRIRGTKRGLEEYLKICTGYNVEIIEEVKCLQIGIVSHVGKDTILGGLPPYHFIVKVNIPGHDTDFQTKRLMIEELIDNEKPIHTKYSLNINGDMK